jgi:hypothetical protein
MTKDHRDNCVKYWTQMWKQGTNFTGGGLVEGSAQAATFDPLEALDGLTKSPASPSDSKDVDFTSCGCRFREQARKLSEELHAGLADHFLGPPIEVRQSSVTTDSESDSSD